MIIETQIWCTRPVEGHEDLERLDVEVPTEDRWSAGCIDTNRIETAHKTKGYDGRDAIKVYFYSGDAATIAMKWVDFQRFVIDEQDSIAPTISELRQ